MVFYPADFLFILFINFLAKYCGQSHLLSLKIYIFSHPFSLCERVANCVNVTVHHEIVRIDPTHLKHGAKRRQVPVKTGP